MDLSVLIMEKEKTIQETLLFQTDNQTLFWKEQLFKVYPELDKEKGLYDSWEKRKEYRIRKRKKFFFPVIKNNMILCRCGTK